MGNRAVARGGWQGAMSPPRISLPPPTPISKFVKDLN